MRTCVCTRSAASSVPGCGRRQLCNVLHASRQRANTQCGPSTRHEMCQPARTCIVRRAIERLLAASACHACAPSGDARCGSRTLTRMIRHACASYAHSLQCEMAQNHAEFAPGMPTACVRRAPSAAGLRREWWDAGGAAVSILIDGITQSVRQCRFSAPLPRIARRTAPERWPWRPLVHTPRCTGAPFASPNAQPDVPPLCCTCMRLVN